MSKKKFSAGSTTMTLKDFHGGSIPSELLLPSAPGISSWTPDRPSAWLSTHNSIASYTGVRADPHRPRPCSSGGIPSVLDDRSPVFFSSISLIGRHFEEDERKPLEASSSLRRPTVAASEPIRSQPFDTSQVNTRSDSKRPLSNPVVAHHLSPSPGVSTFLAGDAWASRKEASNKVGELPQAQPSLPLSGPMAASRFAQASAVEKVSSGRWQTKTPDVEAIKFHDAVYLDQTNVESCRISNVVVGDVGRAFSCFSLKEKKSKDLQSDCILYPIKERNCLEVQSQPKPRESRSAASHQHALNEVSERPKLKLLQRTKPLEPSDSKILDGKQRYLYSTDLMPMEESQERNASKIKPANAMNGPTERLKLNIKPRTQLIEQRDETYARERAKPDVWKLESKSEYVEPRQIEEVEPSPADNQGARDTEGKANRPNSRINENWRGSWKTDKMPLEQLPEPETWRKPAHSINPETPPGTRAMRATSALELAQVFSRPMSDSRVDNHFNNQKMLPGRVPIPFSRLTDKRELYSGSTYRHINGY